MTRERRAARRTDRARSVAAAPAPSSTPATNSRLALGAVLVVALVVKAVVLAELHDHPLLQPREGLDTAYYINLARQVAGGVNAPAGQAFFVSPLYIYFLAAVFFMTQGSLLAARIVQVVLGTCAVGLVYGTARLFVDNRGATIASVLAAATGVVTFYEVVLLQAALDPFLTALELYLVARACLRGRSRLFLAAGLALGLHALNRPNVLAYGAAVPLLILVLRRSHEGRRQAIATVVGIVLVVAPVAVRNYVAGGELIAISSHGGLNFYIGNNAEATGTYHRVPGITPSIEGQAEDANRAARAALGRDVGPSEVSGYFYRRAWDWMAGHPADAAGLFARKIAYVLNNTAVALDCSSAYFSYDEATLLRVLMVGPWLLIPLGMVGLFLLASGGRSGFPHSTTRPRGPSGSLPDSTGQQASLIWAAFILIYGLSVAAFFVSSRYRLPLLIPLSVTSAATIEWFWQSVRNRRWRSTFAGIALVFGLAVFVNWNFRLDDGRAAELTNMTQWLIGQGRIAEARQVIGRPQLDPPWTAPLHLRIGRAFGERGFKDDALSHFRMARERDPGDGEVAFALGVALLDAGQAREAILSLRRALEVGTRPDLSGFALAHALKANGQEGEARETLDRALSMNIPGQYGVDADPAALLIAVADFALQLNAPETAERAMRAAVARTPGSASVHERLGLVLASRGNTPEARGALEEACRLDPASATARLSLGVLYAEGGRFADARRQAEQALRLRPGYPEALDLLAGLGTGKAPKGR